MTEMKKATAQQNIAATIIVPTTGDRGPLLPLSVGSIQRQTLSNIEIFVIGDGVDEATRTVVQGLVDADPRVRFFDHPKDQRRGETYRKEALEQARGEIVCYLCDRDLMLGQHVERMFKALQTADLAYSHTFNLNPDGSIFSARGRKVRPTCLSMVAHRLDYYRSLPFGWRTTPADEYTDVFMWRQFMDQPGCRIAQLFYCTIIYLKRGDHPGLSTLERFEENKAVFARYIDPGSFDYEQEVMKDLIAKEHLYRKNEKLVQKLKAKDRSVRFWSFLRKLLSK